MFPIQQMGDARALDMITPEAGSIYVLINPGYVELRRLNVFHRAGAFFVTRVKRNMNYHRVYSRAVDKTTSRPRRIRASRSMDFTRERTILNTCGASRFAIRKPASASCF